MVPHEASNVAPFLTASIGVAALVVDEDSTPEMLISAADKALYQAKEHGRNQIRGEAPAPLEPPPAIQ